MFYEWSDALKLVRKHKKLVEGQMIHHNRRMKQGVLKEWKKFTLKSRAEKHYNNTVTSKVRRISFLTFTISVFSYDLGI